MGWRYKYINLPNVSINALKAQAVSKFQFKDMTQVQKRLTAWEEYTEKRFIVGKIPSPMPPNVRRFYGAKDSHDLLIYLLYFYEVANQTIVVYTSTAYDIDGAYFFTAMAHLYAFGYRGPAFFVSGNSITGTMNVREYDIGNYKSGAKFTLMNEWGSEEGKYKDFMSSSLPQLKLDKLHSYLLTEGSPTLVLGKYLKGDDDLARFRSLVDDIGVKRRTSSQPSA